MPRLVLTVLVCAFVVLISVGLPLSSASSSVQASPATRRPRAIRARIEQYQGATSGATRFR